MKIENRPKIMLTTKEAEAFGDTMRLMESITRSSEILDANLMNWVNEACTILENIWQNDSIDVE